MNTSYKRKEGKRKRIIKLSKIDTPCTKTKKKKKKISNIKLSNIDTPYQNKKQKTKNPQVNPDKSIRAPVASSFNTDNASKIPLMTSNS